MSWLKEQWQRVKHLVYNDDDLAEEMRLHLELRTAESSDREARIKFGNVTQLQEQSREAWTWPTLESFLQDFRYGIRNLAASPAFTITAILSLTIAIGANAAIFSLLNAIMLRTLPVEDPSRLVNVQLDHAASFTNPLWEEIRDHQTAFGGILASGESQFDLSNGGDRQFANGLMVSGDYFRTLGVPAIRGRVITPEDDRHGCGASGPVAVISERFWQNHFHGDPGIVGRTFTLDRISFQIAGVTPGWFTGLSRDKKYDVAVPIGCEPLFNPDRSALDQRSWWWLSIVGRLKPGAALPVAQQQMSALAPEVMRATVPPKWKPDMQKRYLAKTLDLAPASTGFSGLRREYGTALFTLQGVVAIVLLIACVNVANLLLARAAARQREISVRLAIGAGRARIIRQLLTESLVLASAGAAAGLLLAVWGTRLLVLQLSSASTRSPIDVDTPVDFRVVGFTLLIVVLTTLIFGLLPSLRASASSPNDVLKEHARGSVTGGGRGVTLAKSMVAIQIGLALTLLSAATLFAESFRRIMTVDAGFNANNLVLIQAAAPQANLVKSARIAVFDDALDRIRRIPGVLSASRSTLTPIGHMQWNDDVYPEGVPMTDNEEDRLLWFNRVSPGYFETIGAKLVAGRDFNRGDTLNAAGAIVISESAARQFWGTSNPIGRTISIDSSDRKGARDQYRVIGVVRDMKYVTLTEKPLKSAFLSNWQETEARPETNFELRLDSAESINRTLPLVRAAIRESSPGLSLEIQTLESQISSSLLQPRLVAAVSGFFGMIALILAATGLYGVIAYSTARRKSEIGLRMALGATANNVLWFVLKDISVTLVIGAAVGLIAASLAGSFVQSLVFGIEPNDPSILAAALAVLLITAAIAAYIPARRAALLDPMDSLRIE